MPWSIEQRDGKYCVVKQGESSPVPGGCHASRVDAIKHQRALYASEPAMTADASMDMNCPSCGYAGETNDEGMCPECGMGMMAMTASAAPLKPPPEWFNQPEPDHPEPLTVEPDGRVHGHLAPWDGCHAGMVNGRGTSCVKPPRSLTDYRMFHLGELELADGSAIPVGKIVVGEAGHASISESLQAATAHYDKTGSVAAFVRARNGRHGPFLSGVLRSDITDTQLRDFRANPPSGDWRLMNHNLELVAAVSVPVPGFGIPAMVASAESGEVTALILNGFAEDEDDRGPGYVRAKRMIAAGLQEPMVAAVFSEKARQRLAKSGAAMPDGSFPIRNCSDWQNARQAVGRAAPGKRAAVRAHIAKRGRALGCSDE